ncbi:MAG: quinol dehydrogenase ferredoxin subunit NapH, partial [Gammaproteobacteria bacterium RIFCSPLOWO2_02_FULL_61_13]
PGWIAVWGALMVLVVYLLLGGRAYCAWLCPVNMVTDTAAWLRAVLGISAGRGWPANLRRWMLIMSLCVSALIGTTAWEQVNPVTILQRLLLFGMGMAWLVVLAVFLFDLLVSPRGWCGHICPVGAFYGLLGRASLLRVVAARPDACTNCGACFRSCPEPQVISPALKARSRSAAVILSGDCTNCGRCIDVCAARVFQFGSRFDRRLRPQRD